MRKDYSVWISNSGRKKIESMDTDHIQNCIRNIIQAKRNYNIDNLSEKELKELKKKKENDCPLSSGWCAKHADKYLHVFNYELESR